jgi:hypothetical protein
LNVDLIHLAVVLDIEFSRGTANVLSYSVAIRSGHVI